MYDLAQLNFVAITNSNKESSKKKGDEGFVALNKKVDIAREGLWIQK